MKSTCEALVIGGGPAGAVAAALLARAGWHVVVVERKEFPRRKVCGEYLSATNWPLLHELGVAAVVLENAGPEVRRVGLFVGEDEVIAPLPRALQHGEAWGRGYSREQLDTLLLAQAARCGADVRQPWEVCSLDESDDGVTCRIASVATGETTEIRAPVAIAAHGSWDAGTLPTQPPRRRPRPGDLLGFKAHFLHASLPDDLMPLLCFAGGYGGMVQSDRGRVSLSCCVRRDRLASLPRNHEACAGETFAAYLTSQVAGVRRVLAGATLEGRWLSAGTIRPGLRGCARGRVFFVGNAAGEAHPAVAEGITMAMQSSRLLVERLASARGQIDSAAACATVGRDYAAAWHRCFAARIRVSSAVAQWAMRPRLVQATLPLLRRFPGLLTWGARRSGKTDAAYLNRAAPDAVLENGVCS